MRHSPLTAKLACVLLATLGLTQARAMNAGDLVFTGFNADADTFTMATMVDLAPFSSLYFTDNEWNGLALGAGGAFNAGESYQRWESGASSVKAGTIITFKVGQPGTLSATTGSFGDVGVPGNTGYGLSQTAETLYAYTGNAALNPTGFIASLSTGGFTARDGSIDGTGLTLGDDAIDLPFGADFAEYTGQREQTDSVIGYRRRIGNKGNWTSQAEGSHSKKTISQQAFALLLTPVPEPEGLLLVAAGGGLLWWRRRAAR